MASSKKAPAITYGQVACTSEGVLFNSQSPAGRTKKASVIVRHSAPGSAGEIVYEHGSKLESLWVSSRGHCYVVSKDGFLHSDESGSWKKTRVTKETLLGVGGVGDTLLASTYKGQLFSRSGFDDAFTEVLVDGAQAGTSWFSSFAGSGPDDVYAVSDADTLYFDGERWRSLATPAKGPRTVVALSKDEVFITSFTGLARGSARGTFELVAEDQLQHSAILDGEVYCAAYSSGVRRWKGGALTPIPHDPMSIWSLTAGAFLCATGMQEGIYTFDGKRWTVTTSA